ncbi:hypothetical protein MYP_645 [Sporocytophaga myxococcoides]|uniref:Peptidoglycan binding-like domain-containing protein n=1 Tax=Sporocytophaga myxococcoides TaxID=153721 RepID=A0A098LB61_9BACT|nr:hypothetical protein [Sporocytophaga myxococcoides]GAL83418.1 hypothetical protein MYP_645 [Sporocytophaga myxococcoides]
MKRAKVIITIGLIIVVLTLTAYYFVFKKNGLDSSAPSPGCSDFANQNNNAATFPLKQGSKGVEVKNLQKFLNKSVNAGLCIDGIWGMLTQSAFEKSTLPGIKNGIAPPMNEVSKDLYNSTVLPGV